MLIFFIFLLFFSLVGIHVPRGFDRHGQPFLVGIVDENIVICVCHHRGIFFLVFFFFSYTLIASHARPKHTKVKHTHKLILIRQHKIYTNFQCKI